MKEEIIKYKHWKTGEEKEYNLNEDTTRDERLTPVVCPFDETPLVRCSLQFEKWCECPNCGENYSNTFNQKEINIQAKLKVLEIPKDIKRNKFKEVKFIKKARSSKRKRFDLMGPNKGNLSAHKF